jgi:hypothetical protein
MDAYASDKHRFREGGDAFTIAEGGLQDGWEAFHRVIRGFDPEDNQFGTW